MNHEYIKVKLTFPAGLCNNGQIVTEEAYKNAVIRCSDNIPFIIKAGNGEEIVIGNGKIHYDNGSLIYDGMIRNARFGGVVISPYYDSDSPIVKDLRVERVGISMRDKI